LENDGRFIRISLHLAPDDLGYIHGVLLKFLYHHIDQLILDHNHLFEGLLTHRPPYPLRPQPRSRDPAKMRGQASVSLQTMPWVSILVKLSIDFGINNSNTIVILKRQIT
jgi:hypothetical protein